MSKKRRVFPAEFKAKVALEAIKEQETINQIASLLSLPQNADLLFCRIPFRFHLSGSFLGAQTNFSSGTVQVISTTCQSAKTGEIVDLQDL